MRVLMLSDFYPPAIGGVEQHVWSLAHALVRRGHSISVATIGLDGDRPAVDDGVRVHRLRSSAQRLPRLFARQDRPWCPPAPDPELVLGLRSIVAAERPDVVHGHDWLARSFQPLTRRGAAFVVTLHYYTMSCARKDLMRHGAPCDGPSPYTCIACAARHYGAVKGPIVALANGVFARAERSLADRIIAVSRATAIGNGLTPDEPSTTIIPNFVSVTRTTDELDVAPYVGQLPAGPFLLFVGDLRRIKGLPILLAAYQQLIDPPPLVLIGKPWSETPSDLPPGVIRLENWPNAAVRAAWDRCLFGIAPSIWPEPFGIVLIEAMASARAVVASRIGGIPEVVVDGETGLLVAPGDAASLAQAIARLLGDPDLRLRMGQAAVRRARDFSEERVVPRIERVYAEALAARRDRDVRRVEAT